MYPYGENSKIKEKFIRKGKNVGREQERMKRKLETNPVIEYNLIQKKFCPDLFKQFSETSSLRDQSYILYNSRVMLETVYYKGIAGLSSVRAMTYEFNSGQVTGNILEFLGEERSEFLPHGVTVNEYLDRLDSNQIQGIQQSLVYDLIRRRTFDEA